jgi:enamine deaminase RidA (YjgF/YER057c/UK114 family)
MRQNISSGGDFEPIFGYSRAVRVDNQVHVSGTVARPPHDTADAHTQAVAALDIIEQALAEAGAALSDVVRTVVYVTDMGDADAVARAHGARVRDILPASTLVEVSALLKPQLKVEIEAYAVLRN